MFMNESLSVYILKTSDNFIIVIVESTNSLNESISGAVAIEVEKNANKLDHIVEIKIYNTAGSSSS